VLFRSVVFQSMLESFTVNYTGKESSVISTVVELNEQSMAAGTSNRTILSDSANRRLSNLLTMQYTMEWRSSLTNVTNAPQLFYMWMSVESNSASFTSMLQENDLFFENSTGLSLADSPTLSPTLTWAPTRAPTRYPATQPLKTLSPTLKPTRVTWAPTRASTRYPATQPLKTLSPTLKPTRVPSKYPSLAPTNLPIHLTARPVLVMEGVLVKVIYNGIGWIGVAGSQTGMMLDAKGTVIGLPTGPNTVSNNVMIYNMTSQDVAGIIPRSANQQYLQNASIIQNDNDTVMEFKMPFPPNPLGLFPVIWAYGKDNTFQYHGPDNRGGPYALVLNYCEKPWNLASPSCQTGDPNYDQVRVLVKDSNTGPILTIYTKRTDFTFE